MFHYEMELQLLGVVVGFNKNYQLVTDHLKSQACSKYPTAEAILLIFECMRHCERNSRSYNKLLQALKGDECLKTNKGYKFPSECFLPNTDWDCLLKVFSNDFPLIDEDFYGTKILSYRNELKHAGVVVEFELAAQRFLLGSIPMWPCLPQGESLPFSHFFVPCFSPDFQPCFELVFWQLLRNVFFLVFPSSSAYK